ncbi:hypothetical protein [Paenibacillus etheri]|uniref:Uncharacterized protein n=1 Tax=Paenibacillus etheri TaxID=1306852 RepID=A0A0W1ATM7_9BACL|nr:hypothetical protein [Paenibacillus etheri]KTD84716.1 hypothetical protein UQ64_24025 [Paenibacillus etheri]
MSNLTSDQLIKLMKASDKTLNVAKLMVEMLPILLIYPFLQALFRARHSVGLVKEWRRNETRGSVRCKSSNGVKPEA